MEDKKTCTKCKEEKTYQEYYFCSATKKYLPSCKECLRTHYRNSYTKVLAPRGFDALAEDKKEEIKKLLEIGMPISAIARKVGIDRIKLGDWNRRGKIR